MGSASESPLDRLWKEYSKVFRDFDDHTLARWLCQTLGQLEGRVWRMSHPLVSAYRLGAQVGQDKQIWFKRLATAPMAYPEAGCCRSPLLPLFTRDVVESGFVCHHCGESCVPFDEIPSGVQEEIRSWSGKYGQLHEVAHWDDGKRKQVGNYDARFEDAASKAEQLLWVASTDIMPRLLEHYPAVVWEDQDECLEVRPEDIEM